MATLCINARLPLRMLDLLKMTFKYPYSLPLYHAPLYQCTPSLGGRLLTQLQHDIRHFHIFFCLIFDGHLKDDILLMVWDWLLADCLDQLAESAVPLVDKACFQHRSNLLETHPILELVGRIEAGVQQADP